MRQRGGANNGRRKWVRRSGMVEGAWGGGDGAS